MERAGQCRPALDCYFRSIPERRGYRQRMIDPWNERGMFKITKQRMADQERAIPRNHWLTNLELEEMRRCASRSPSTEVPTTDSMSEICEQLPKVEETLVIVDDVNEDWFKGQGAIEEEKQIAIRLRQIAESSDRQRLPASRLVQRKRLMEETRISDKVLGRMMSSDITHTKNLAYTGAVVVTERLGVKPAGQRNVKDP